MIARDDVERAGTLSAIDPTDGSIKWQLKTDLPVMSGALATAGNLVFGATSEGQIFALNATNGKELWRFQGGGTVRSNPMSYMSDGKQYVAMALGNSLYVFHVQ